MYLVAPLNSVITLSTMKSPRLTLWPLTLFIFSLVAFTSGCKPAKPSEKWNPMCSSNPSVPKVCPLSLTRKCPNLLLSDFSTSQTSMDSHNQQNFGLVNWNSAVGIHAQSSIIFFFLGAASAVAVMLGVQRCRQGRRHKRTMRDLLSRIASSSASAANTAQGAPARAAVLPLFPQQRLQLGAPSQGPQAARGALPQLDYKGPFIPLS